MEFFTLTKEYQDSIGNSKKVYKVNDVIKTFVKFDIFNLMSPVPPVRNCDLVLCRNVMIYFNQTDRASIVQRMNRALVPGGLLFVGHSESIRSYQAGFISEEPAVYRKRD